MNARRILVVTGSRADFGIWRSVLNEAKRRPAEVSPSLLVTAMHLDERFGGTVDEVRKMSMPIAAEVPCIPSGDSRGEMAGALGSAIIGMAPIIEQEHPDWLMLLGDRGEQLAAAIVGLHLGIAVAHLHGGERTMGAVDDTMRDMISRVSHLHFVATADAARRLTQMGEEAWRIHLVGAPGLDLLRDEAAGDINVLRDRFGLGLGRYLILLYHPETVGTRSAADDLAVVLRAVQRIGLPTLAIAPNADAGGRAMLEGLRTAEHSDALRFAPSLSRSDYATLLKGAAALIGNSSSGLIEAPLLSIPAVNVGGRQRGRTKGDNVIDVAVDEQAIATAIELAMSDRFVSQLSGKSPYGNGSTARHIVDILADWPIDGRRLMKTVGTG